MLLKNISAIENKQLHHIYSHQHSDIGLGFHYDLYEGTETIKKKNHHLHFSSTQHPCPFSKSTNAQ